LWSRIGVEGGAGAAMNEPLWANRRPYLYSEINYGINLADNLWADANLNYSLYPRDDLADSKGDDSIGWSYLGFDMKMNLNVTDSSSAYLKHEIDLLLTPDYRIDEWTTDGDDWSITKISAGGNGYNGLFGIGAGFFTSPHFDFYLPVTYAQAYSENFDTQVELQSKIGVNILDFWDMWIRMDLGFTDGLKRGKDNDSAYRGIIFNSSYSLGFFYISTEFGFPNIEDYGYDLTFGVWYNGIEDTSLWAELPLFYVGNKLDRNPAVGFTVGISYNW
jgi:hypothetical protein